MKIKIKNKGYKNIFLSRFLFSIFLAVLFLFSIFYFLDSNATYAATNISSDVLEHWAWNDAIGWVDFYSTDNVNISSTQISGYASSSIGYIAFDCATTPNGDLCGGPSGNWKVSNDGSGGLSGWAWNDQIGWIVFNCSNTSDNCLTSNYSVNISNGDFSGWAWNDIIGWLSFNCNNSGIGNTCLTGGSGSADYKVSTTWFSTPLTGNLTSSIFDTQVTGGAAINTIMWQGSLNNGAVKFQIASSNSLGGPWDFIGPGASPSTYYEPSGPNAPVKIEGVSHNNKRYVRYKIFLESNVSRTTSPGVEDVIINFSP